jgi:hypothetical protein
MTSAALGSVLQALSLLFAAMMAFKLFTTGLYKRYPFFFAYFLFKVPNGIWPLCFTGTGSALYAYLWVWTTPIGLLFYVLLVIELYRLILENYPGLYTVGRWTMYLSVAISITISALTLLPKLSPALPQRTRKLAYVFIAERGIDTALALFIFLLLLFLSRYPIQLSRNARIHAVIYCIFFLSSTLGLLIRGFFGMRLADAVNTALTGVTVSCILAWLILLRPAGEEVRAPQKRKGTAQEERLLTQLDVLNATLLRVSRQHSR